MEYSINQKITGDTMKIKINTTSLTGSLFKLCQLIKSGIKSSHKGFKSLFHMDEYIAFGKHIVEHCGSRPETSTYWFTPPDLQNNQGNWLRTKNGYAVSGVLLMEDRVQGCQSPAAPIFMALFPFVWIIANLIGATHIPYLSQTADILIKCIYVYFFARFFGIGGVFTLLLCLFPSMIVGSVLHFVPGEYGFMVRQQIDKFTAYSYLLPCLFPVFYKFLFNREFAKSLGEQSVNFNKPALQQAGEQARKQRDLQAINVYRQKAMPIVIGYAEGVTSRAGDFLGPDEGKEFIQNKEDLKLHAILFGAPGTGKSTLGTNIIYHLCLDEHLSAQYHALPQEEKELFIEQEVKQVSDFRKSVIEKLAEQEAEDEEQNEFIAVL
jgi:hypothetical protein